MTFKDNPEYKEIFHSKVHDVRFYEPANTTEGYHISRYVAASAQNTYSASGVTKDMLSKLMDGIIGLCNDTKANVATLRTDIATLAKNVQYRTKYPIDEDCALRMSAIYTFIPGENPENVNDIWTQKKVEMAKADSDLYAFFLNRGIVFTPAYNELLSHLEDSAYFPARIQNLSALTLPPSPKK